MGQARLAIFGGAILVGLVVLAEFGAFEILGYQTLTTEIYNEFQVGFNEPAACALSLILVLLGALLLASEDTVRGHGSRGTPGRRCGARTPASAAGPPPARRARRTRSPGRAGARRPGRSDRLSAAAGGQQHAARCGIPARRDVEHVRVRRRGGCRRHAGGRSDRPPVGAFPAAQGAHPGAIESRGPRRARPGDRVEPRLRDRALPAGPLLPDEPVAGCRLRHHVLSSGRGVGPRRRGAGPGRASRRWPARSGSAGARSCGASRSR